MYSVEKITLRSPSPHPPAGGGGRGGGIIMPLGEEGEVWKAFGTSGKEILYLERDLQTFTGIEIFRFSFRFWLISLSFFFAVWSVSLDCEQSEKKHFFSLQSENENPHIFACFRLKRIWAAHPRSWEYINRSQTHEWGNWDWGRAIPRKGIHKWDFCCSAYTAGCGRRVRCCAICATMEYPAPSGRNTGKTVPTSQYAGIEDGYVSFKYTFTNQSGNRIFYSPIQFSQLIFG